MAQFDDLMRELEELNLHEDNESEDEDDAAIEEQVTDWDLIIRDRKGTDRTSNTVIAALNDLKLEPNVYHTTLEYYRAVLEGEEKIKFKNALMCASVFMAYIRHDDPREEKQLMEYFKTSKNKYTKALVALKKTVSDTRTLKRSFDNDMFSICRDLGITADQEEIKTFVIDCYSKITHSTLSEKTLKCSLLYIWLLNEREVIPSIKVFSKTCLLSYKSVGRVVYKYRRFMNNKLVVAVSREMRSFKDAVKKAYRIDINDSTFIKNYIKYTICEID